MHILFLTHYFPPEVNAPASRTFENAKRWVRSGHRVTVITCVPNHPRGVVYPGYRNKLWQWDELEGVRILRIGTYLSPNEGFLKRTSNYVSYMLTSVLLSPLAGKADVIISTSPQFFCGMAGYFVSRIKCCPWVLEIRDLWPESIIAVGAINNRKVIRALEDLETFLYRKADHIVSLTNSFKKHIMNRGVNTRKISVITNGADLDQFAPLPRENQFLLERGLEGKFVVSYVGTHGMAHALETVLQAAKLLEAEKTILFLLVGDGAERERLLKMKEEMNLENVLMIPQQRKDTVPQILAASDVCMVLLRKTELFKTVIPSKIFEAMAMERAIVLGLEGECRRIIEEGECGIAIEPENPRELADAVVRLYREREYCRTLGSNGHKYVIGNYSRDTLANYYLEALLSLPGVRSHCREIGG